MSDTHFPVWATYEIKETRKSFSTIEITITGYSKGAVLEGIQTYESMYHPLGYGTSLSEPSKESPGRWVSRGTRGDSCD